MVALTKMRIGIILEIHLVPISDTIVTDPKKEILTAVIRCDIAMVTTKFHNSPSHSPYTCSRSVAPAGLNTGNGTLACKMTGLVAVIAFANAGPNPGIRTIAREMTRLVTIVAIANARLNTVTRTIACQMAELITAVAVAIESVAIIVAVSITRTNI